jgi:primosomal protein N'
VIQADQGANAGDPRCSERIYQLLSQVRGRCGRAGLASQVILQVSELPKLLTKDAIERTREANSMIEIMSKECEGITEEIKSTTEEVISKKCENYENEVKHGLNEMKNRDDEGSHQRNEMKNRDDEGSHSTQMASTMVATYQLLKAVIRNDFDAWSEKELSIRKEQKLPPYYRLIRIIVISRDPNKSRADAIELYNRIQKGLLECVTKDISSTMQSNEKSSTANTSSDEQEMSFTKDKQIRKSSYTIFPPVQTPIYKYKLDFRYSMLIRFDGEEELLNNLRKLLKQKLAHGSSIMADVDPYSFF